MEILFTCQYCNFQWRKDIYSGKNMDESCGRCGDLNIEAKELSKARIDSYEGCPPFEEKKEENQEGGDIDFPYWRNGD